MRITIRILPTFIWLVTRCFSQTLAAARPVTVADSIEMNVASRSREALSYFSPDKSQFVVVTHKGDIPANSNVYSIWLFKSADAFQSPRAVEIATISTTTNQPAIRDLRWMDDTTLVFLGAIQESGKAPIYALNVPARKLSKLYEYDGSIVAFDATRDLSAVALILHPPAEKYYDPVMGNRGIRVEAQQLADLLANRKQGVDQLIVQRRGKPPKTIRLDGGPIQSNISFSPEGHRLVVAQPIPAGSKIGSPQESDRRPISRGFPESDKFGLGNSHALRLE